MSLITTFAPAYALFINPYEWAVFQGDLKKFRSMIDGKLEPIPRIAAPSVRNIRLLAKQPFFTLDIETAPDHHTRPWTGKDPRRAKLKLIGVGCEAWGLSLIPYTHIEAIAAVKRLCANPKATLVWHNGIWFDQRVLERYGFIFKCKMVDTRDARRALSATSRLSLAYCTSIYAQAHPWKKNEEDDSKGLVFTQDIEKLRKYNSYDCSYDARVWRGIKAEPEWNTQRVQKLYDVQTRIARIAAKMHDNGIPIDRERLVWMKWALLKEYVEKERAFIEAVGIPGFKCSPNCLRALIYARHAKGKYAEFGRFNLPDPYQPEMYTNEEMETCSVDEDSLTQLLIDPSSPSDLKSLIKLYWAAEETWKRRSTFVASEAIRQAIGQDWRMRPGWNSAGTDTGRWSCSSPNAMNIEKILRWMYKAAPGRCLVGADYSQLELRVMAAVSKDRVLKHNLDAGDVYTADAIDWFGLPPTTTKSTCDSRMRKGCKIIHLGSQYAAGAATIHRQALKQDRNFEWHMTRALHAKFLKTYVGTTDYWRAEHERVCAMGYSASRVLDRRRVYPREPPPTETANYPIQSTAGDIANIAIIALDERLSKEVPTAKLCVQLHDAFMVDCDVKDSQKVSKILTESMETEHIIDGDSYVFRVEVEVGDSWDEL